MNSSWAESKTVSQFSTLTTKLKDKLHPPRRRSEPFKDAVKITGKPEPEPQNQNHQVLLDRQRDVVSSLQYFKAVVDRLGLDKGDNRQALDWSVVGRLLGGASSGVLESVKVLVQLGESETVSARLTPLYEALAQLIHWADQVMLRGVSDGSKESTDSVTTVIRAVLDNVKEFVRLAADKHKVSVPLPSVKSQAVVGQTGHFDDQETSNNTICFGSVRGEDKDDGLREQREGAGQTGPAPPKPPKPCPQSIVSLSLNPPALPPKKRQSAGPASCKVGIVAPMRYEPDEKLQVEQDDCLKKFSTARDSSCDADPDYCFLTTDMSGLKTPGPNPALPEKKRCSTGLPRCQTPPPFGFDPAPGDEGSAHSNDVSGADANKSPPPLPEKTRHIHQYLQFCSFYNGQSAASFYQRPSTFRSNSTRTHLDSHLDTDSAPSAEHPPALPPKKKQQDSDEQLPEDQQQNTHSLQSDQREEVLLTNQEIIPRITRKSEEEEGPDLKAASADVLLVLATDSGQQPYQDVFLCTYRGFFSPMQVIRRLQDRYPPIPICLSSVCLSPACLPAKSLTCITYKHLSERQEPEDLKNSGNAFNLLLKVMDELCVTEVDSDLLRLLMDLVFSLLTGGELGPAHLLHTSVLSSIEKRWELVGSPQSLAARSVAARPGTLLDFRSQDLAEQMTLLDSALFHKIQLPEVLLWSKEQNEEKSPNLTKFTQHFNNMSYWVSSVIILQEKPQDREKLLLKFLKVMKHLRKLNNFNSYLSILSALDSAPLRRLDWQKNSCEAVEEFSAIIDSSSSFRAYRAALAEAEPPCIPYIGLILQDLTFVHLGNPDTLMTSQGSKVNFSKCWQQFNILETLRSYQQVPYSLQSDDDIISFFNDFSDHLAQEALWELSLRIRPKNTPRANQR
ncbi:unnamed protein product [Ophioblennius macclurei]